MKRIYYRTNWTERETDDLINDTSLIIIVIKKSFVCVHTQGYCATSEERGTTIIVRVCCI